MWDDFMRGILLTSDETQVMQVKMMRIKHALMKIGSIGDAPNNLCEAHVKNRGQTVHDFRNASQNIESDQV